MHQLDKNMLAAVSGAGPSIFTPENAGIAGGIGSGIGANVAIDLVGGFGNLTGTGAVTVGAAGGAGLLASYAAGAAFGSWLYENVPAVAGTAEGIVDSFMTKGFFGAIGSGLSETGKLFQAFIGYTLHMGNEGPQPFSSWNYVE